MRWHPSLGKHSVRLHRPFEDVEIKPRRGVRPGEPSRRFSSPATALTFLRQYLDDPSSMARLREIEGARLRDPFRSGSGDQAVLEELARQLVDGRLSVVTLERALRSGQPVEPAQTEPKQTEEPASPPSTPEPVPEPPTNSAKATEEPTAPLVPEEVEEEEPTEDEEEDEEEFQVTIVSMEGLCFHTDREVLLPDPLLETGDALTPRVTHLTLAKAVLEYAAAHPERKMLVAGHTDTSGQKSHNLGLSERRADNVYRFLSGDRDGWASHAHEFHETGDLQHMLKWTAFARGWECDPGPVDDDFGSQTETALESFRTRYNDEFDAALAEDRRSTTDDWGAFFAVFDQALCELMGCEQSELDQRRGALSFLSTPWIGCGEEFPTAGVGLDGYESQQNRRVELLFFDDADAPNVDTDPPGDEIYGQDKFTPEHVQPMKVRGGRSLWVRIDGGAGVTEFAERFVLTSSDGALTSELVPHSHGIPAGDHVDLFFTGLDAEQSYSLECASPDGESKRHVFDAVSYADLEHLSASVTPNDDPEWDPSEVETDVPGGIR